ncbi:NAD(P)-binding protein [Setomelanomma holmii]|uniref:NAD(P)-binding protein n=1 Tax=Setomelanomma holmii TaxID=210430 RepID=A0A9P4H4X5_9PLEO|nr:NAD(P)-binding protein [Setomelanomma holmii]
MAATQTPVWFITAASSGFGKYIALEALSRGHKVIASARSSSRIEDLKEKGAETVALDVTSPLPEIEQVAKEANEKYGYISHLVNVAGYILVGAVEETSPEEDYAIFNTNVFGMLNVSKAFLPYLRAGSGHRTIANFGSIGSWFGSAGGALYAGTKWACSGITESMRAELAPLDIAVTAIEPGYFRTGFLNASAQVKSERTIKEYQDTAAGELRRVLDVVNNNQHGDVLKGSKVIVDILTRTGVAEGKDVPIRVALGSDAPVIIGGKCGDTLKFLKEWDGITNKTDHQ